MQPPNQTFDAALAAFVAAAQAIVDAYFARNFPNQGAVLSIDPNGKRYRRIVRASTGLGEGARSVHCFVDSTNGDVLYPAGWKGPAKHARGNIYAANPVSGMGPHGARTL